MNFSYVDVFFLLVWVSIKFAVGIYKIRSHWYLHVRNNGIIKKSEAILKGPKTYTLIENHYFLNNKIPSREVQTLITKYRHVTVMNNFYGQLSAYQYSVIFIKDYTRV